MKKKWTARGLATALVIVCLAGSMGEKEAQAGLMEGVHVKQQERVALKEAKKHTAALTGFGLRLFEKCMNENPKDNMLISPLSVAEAFGMAGNGACGTSGAQIGKVTGMDTQTLNQYLYSYSKSLPQGEKYKLEDANSIWFRDVESLDVKQDFLQKNADWYGADAYAEPFDQTTCNKINEWVKKHTDGMIDQIINEIPEDSMIHLINALAFEAEWDVVYEPDQVWDDRIFTDADGRQQPVTMMYCGENKFLEDELATGFVKYYKDHSYAYVALLPNEGVSVADYVKTLTGTHVQEMLANPTEITVNTGIPAYKAQTGLALQDILQDMGMKDVFSPAKADLSAMATATDNLYISSVIHKTYIEVDAKGTKAAAVTDVAVATGAMVTEEKTVILDRPFVYMIVDCKQKLPVFIGVLNKIEK